MNDRSAKRYKIMLIDDDPLMIALETTLLEAAGHDMTALQSTEDALPKIKSQAPDCVLIDVMMPGIDGMQLLKQIRDDPGLSAIKVIMVSAKTFEYDQRAAMQLGADSFITKEYRSGWEVAG